MDRVQLCFLGVHLSGFLPIQTLKILRPPQWTRRVPHFALKAFSPRSFRQILNATGEKAWHPTQDHSAPQIPNACMKPVRYHVDDLNCC